MYVKNAKPRAALGDIGNQAARKTFGKVTRQNSVLLYFDSLHGLPSPHLAVICHLLTGWSKPGHCERRETRTKSRWKVESNECSSRQTFEPWWWTVQGSAHGFGSCCHSLGRMRYGGCCSRRGYRQSWPRKPTVVFGICQRDLRVHADARGKFHMLEWHSVVFALNVGIRKLVHHA